MATTTLGPLILATLVTFSSAAPPAPATGLADIERAVVEAVNESRRQRGLAPMTPDPDLADIARQHSCAMAKGGFFEPTAPDGKTMGDRLKAAGKHFAVAGENIARIESRDPAARAVAGWLKSPTHRENMLSPRFTTTGVGACRAGRAVFLTEILLRPR